MDATKLLLDIVENVEKVIIGKRPVVLKVLAALIAGGHILVEDVPGVGKTQLVSALSRSVNGVFHRVQMTPDIMPSDVLGFSMIHPTTKEIIYQRGPVFCNFFLADEINRASPKAQSSLLEVMEERQVSIEGETLPLPSPFMVLATQNPVETYGTYHLPEAQMDRFIMRITMGYPDRERELRILREISDNQLAKIEPVTDVPGIIDMQQAVQKINASRLLTEYIWEIVNATRVSEFVRLGASPRGGLALLRVSRAIAFMHGRNHVLPDDVREVAVSVLAHRLILSQKGRAAYQSQETLLHDILTAVPVPYGSYE
jgi:MoxR-like ATPase